MWIDYINEECREELLIIVDKKNYTEIRISIGGVYHIWFDDFTVATDEPFINIYKRDVYIGMININEIENMTVFYRED